MNWTKSLKSISNENPIIHQAVLRLVSQGNALAG
jgi:hypothetical protein